MTEAEPFTVVTSEMYEVDRNPLISVAVDQPPDKDTKGDSEVDVCEAGSITHAYDTMIEHGPLLAARFDPATFMKAAEPAGGTGGVINDSTPGVYENVAAAVYVTVSNTSVTGRLAPLPGGTLHVILDGVYSVTGKHGLPLMYTLPATPKFVPVKVSVAPVAAPALGDDVGVNDKIDGAVNENVTGVVVF